MAAKMDEKSVAWKEKCLAPAQAVVMVIGQVVLRVAQTVAWMGAPGCKDGAKDGCDSG